MVVDRNDGADDNLVDEISSLIRPCRDVMGECNDNDCVGERLSIEGCSDLGFVVGKRELDCLASDDDMRTFMNLRFLDIDDKLISCGDLIQCICSTIQFHLAIEFECSLVRFAPDSISSQ